MVNIWNRDTEWGWSNGQNNWKGKEGDMCACYEWIYGGLFEGSSSILHCLPISCKHSGRWIIINSILHVWYGIGLPHISENDMTLAVWEFFLYINANNHNPKWGSVCLLPKYDSKETKPHCHSCFHFTNIGLSLSNSPFSFFSSFVHFSSHRVQARTT